MESCPTSEGSSSVNINSAADMCWESVFVALYHRNSLLEVREGSWQFCLSFPSVIITLNSLKRRNTSRQATVDNSSSGLSKPLYLEVKLKVITPEFVGNDPSYNTVGQG